MKKKVISSILLLPVFLCSCERDVSVPTETKVQNSIESTIIPENVTYRTHVTTVRETFIINTLESEVNFDDILSVVVEYSGMDYYDPYDDIQDTNIENRVSYTSNSEDIVHFWESTTVGLEDAIPSEIYYETREFEFDRRGIFCFEFSSPEWAEYLFERNLDVCLVSYTPDGLVCNNSDEGYCICYTSSGSFFAQYLINNCVFSIGFRIGNVGTKGYEEYLDICTQLGLPTSEEITEAIL